MGNAPCRVTILTPLQTNGPGFGEEKLRNAMGKTKKGHSAGACKSSLKHGVSNKLQASWLQENDRQLRLEDHGMDADGVSKAGCK
eukprot:1160640-Pelagomonas_calceolata.AAC.6